jgi:hypothetical protein
MFRGRVFGAFFFCLKLFSFLKNKQKTKKRNERLFKGLVSMKKKRRKN